MIRILASKDVGRLLARKAARFTEADAPEDAIAADHRLDQPRRDLLLAAHCTGHLRQLEGHGSVGDELRILVTDQRRTILVVDRTTGDLLHLGDHDAKRIGNRIRAVRLRVLKFLFELLLLVVGNGRHQAFTEGRAPSVVMIIGRITGLRWKRWFTNRRTAKRIFSERRRNY